MDDIAQAAVKYIATLTPVTALLGVFAAGDRVTANAGRPYLFNTDIMVTLEGTGRAALVCTDYGSDGTARPLSTAQFHRLSIDIWVDPLRDAAGNAMESAGATVSRGKALFTTLNHYLHRTNPVVQQWGDLVTTGCQLRVAPQFFGVTDTGPGRAGASGTTNRPQRGTAFYGVDSFGWVDASV